MNVYKYTDKLTFSFTAGKSFYLNNSFGRSFALPKKFEHSCVLQPIPTLYLYPKETHKHEYQEINTFKDQTALFKHHYFKLMTNKMSMNGKMYT